MAIYRYQHGDRPLDGFTIQHGLGRGGFGEVYYAISDSGRNVALKAVQNYEDIELRGIGACMNFKHAQLVSIFDIKHNEQGLPFVIMEYVDGPSLRQILDAHPGGLGAAKAAYFLREIAKGLSYLHDCGVVHRDLKPHNVFWEQGVVKIGDYSLSKAISTSHRSGHTVTVGTVHYMAPEISMGQYDHTVDIYAMGVLLYEMLTGHPPFLGTSMGEVLMKHVAGDVDLSGIDEPFARVIKKALAKEPEQRYQTAQEMIDDLFEHVGVQDSVAALGPESLTLVAERALGVPQATAPPTVPPTVPHAQPHHRDAPWKAEVVRRARVGHRWPHRGRRKPRRHDYWKPFLGDGWPKLAAAADDPMRLRARFGLMVLAFASIVVAFIVLGEGPLLRHAARHGRAQEAAVFGIFIVAAGTLASLFTQFLVLKRTDPDSSGLFRLMHGLVVALVVMLFGLGTGLVPVALAVSASMFVLAWRVMGSPLRPSRVSVELLVWPMAVAGIVALVTSGFEPGNLILAVSIVASIAVLVQLASPFDPQASRQFWRQGIHQSTQGRRPPTPPPEDRKPSAPAADKAAFRVDPPKQDDAAPRFEKPASHESLESGSASPYGRFLALLFSVLFFPFGIAGLQRFYVGRIFSGFIWLITFGIFGIGQLVDIIMIAVGQFKDVHGKRVLAFTKETSSQIVKPVNEYSAVLRDSWTDSRIGFKLGNLFLNLVGAILLVACLVIGAIVAVDLPQAIADGVFGREMADDIARDTFRDWYILVNNVLAFVLVIVGTVAAGCLLFARRHTTVRHMARVPLALVGLVISMTSLGAATQFGRKWGRIGDDVANRMLGSAFATLFEHEFWPALVFACVAFVASIFILAWPARRVEPPVQTSSVVRAESARENHEKQTV